MTQRSLPVSAAHIAAEEMTALMSQIATSNAGRAPLVFTEHGALVAATLLNSTRAVEVSLYVVRAFVRVNAVANATLNSGMASDVTERSII